MNWLTGYPRWRFGIARFVAFSAVATIVLLSLVVLCCRVPSDNTHPRCRMIENGQRNVGEGLYLYYLEHNAFPLADKAIDGLYYGEVPIELLPMDKVAKNTGGSLANEEDVFAPRRPDGRLGRYMYALITPYYWFLIARGPDGDIDLGPEQLRMLQKQLAEVQGDERSVAQKRATLVREFTKPFRLDLSRLLRGGAVDGDIIRIME